MDAFPFVDCGDFEVIFDETDIVVAVTDHYDRSGALVVRQTHVTILGRSVYFNSTDPSKRVEGVPGERENNRIFFADGEVSKWYLHGPYNMITVPGYGRILAETGTFIFDESGDLIFNSGLNQLMEGDTAALCNYLR
jgi:hypothetical protein